MDTTAIFARSEKDIPEWARHNHNWEATTDVTKLKKLQVKMRLCCNSCVEKVGEEIRGMRGVFDFKTDKTNDLLTIFESPGDGPSHKQLLKKLKKVDKRAKIVQTSSDCRESDECSEKIIYVAMPIQGPGMVPWNPAGTSLWPMFPNFNYVQHRVSCSQCLGCPDAACSNCGRS